MTAEAYIEDLRLCPLRPGGPLPRASSRLVELVRDHGAIEPVVVRRVGKSYEILGNVETWMAAQQVQLDRVPIHVLENIGDDEAADIVAASFADYNANPIDEAEYFASQLEDSEQGQYRHNAVQKLAYRTRYKRPYISHALRLLKLPLSIQEQVRGGYLNAGQARALVTLKNPAQQRALADRAVRESLSVRQVEALARALRNQRSSKHSVAEKPTSKSVDILRLERTISDLVGCQFEIQDGKAVFDFFADIDVLAGLLERLGYHGE